MKTLVRCATCGVSVMMRLVRSFFGWGSILVATLSFSSALFAESIPIQNWDYQYAAGESLPPAPALMRAWENESNWKPTERPWNPAGRDGRSILYLRTTIEPAHSDQDVIYVNAIDQGARVISDDKVVYEFALDAAGRLDFSGYPFHLIDLGKKPDGFIYFALISEHSNIGLVGEPRVGSMEEHVTFIFRNDDGRSIVSVLISSVGILALVLFVWDRQRVYAGLAITAIGAATYLYCRTEIKQFYIGEPLVWLYLELGSFYLFPAGVYLYLASFVRAKLERALLIFTVLQVCFAVIAFGLVSAGLVAPLQTLIGGQVAVAFLALVLVVFSIYQLLRDTSRHVGRMLAIGVLFGVAGIVVDLVSVLVLNSALRLAHLGALVAIVVFALALVARYLEALRQAERLRRGAEMENRELDQRVLDRTRALERSQSELVQLNSVVREMNATAELDVLLTQIFAHFFTEYGIEAIVMQLVDEDSNELYTYKTTAPPNATREMIQYSRQLRLPLDETSGIIHRTYLRKKPFYLRRVTSTSFPDGSDREIVDRLQLSSFALFPLIIGRRCIGMLLFTSYDHRLKLTQHDIASLSRFCDQIAGAIHTSSLLRDVESERKRSDELLNNVLPVQIAEELRHNGHVQPQQHDSATIMFTDFRSFTSVVERMSANELIVELDQIFNQFDWICDKNGIEKLKTIGDAYMCAGGLPRTNNTHVVDACLAAMEIQSFMRQTREIKKSITGEEFWQLRIGLHTGSVVAGVVGKNKFIYDVWGDAVNIASRMESNGTPGKINVSRAVYDQVRYFFTFEARGYIETHNRGPLEMFYLTGIRPELARDEECRVPGPRFKELYEKIKQGARLRFRSELKPVQGSETSTTT